MPSLFLPTVSVVVIDTLSHDLAERALAHSLAAIRFGDALFISDRPCRLDGVRSIQIPPIKSRDAYSRFVLRDLLAHVRTDHVLLIQWDGYVVNPAAWEDAFLEYDYIGARWGFHQDEHCVGNGGFSLRSRRLLEALHDPVIEPLDPEDEIICRRYRPLLESRHGIRFAPPEVADRFSFETTYPNGVPFGFHGLFNMWIFVGDEEMQDFVDAMPTSTLGSLQLRQMALNLVEIGRHEAARVVLQRRLAAFPGDAECTALLARLAPGTITPATDPLATAEAPSQAPRTARNAPCPCGSGKRYKHCCGVIAAEPPPAPETPPTGDFQSLARQAFEHHQAGRLDSARQAYEAALRLQHDPLLLHFLGVVDMQQGEPETGERRIRAALALRSDIPDMHNNLGLSLRAQGRLDEALTAYRSAITLNPAHAAAWNNLGLDLNSLGRYDEALNAFDRALERSPQFAQARFGRALVLLTRGDFARGWTDYEYRARCPEYAAQYRLPAMTALPRPWKDPSDDLDGHALLLLAEQGIGDTLQFVRYAAGLQARGVTVNLYTTRPETARLLRGAKGVTNVFVRGEQVPEHDYACFLMSLPRLCGTSAPGEIPASTPYLEAPPASRAAWRKRLASLPARQLQIGLCWAGNPGHPNDHNRSCPLTTLAPLLDVDGVNWISLQVGKAQAPIAQQGWPLVDWSKDFGDYAETAALISELDLVISVDTSVAHAAGALGIPVWLMLPHVPDFRWLLDRRDSPWYPGMRLFRQAQAGDWPGVVQTVRTELEARLRD